MFTAMVLACAFINAPKCLQFEDTRGPYRTEEQCIERIGEMITNIREISPYFTIIDTNCSTSSGQQT
jgi:hypothetical protein